MKPIAKGVALRLFVGFAFALTAFSFAADEPPMKEGLWSVHTETTSQPGDKKVVGNRSLCRSHAYDDDVRARAKALAANCKSMVDKYEGGKYESETECAIAGTTARGKTTVTRTGDDAEDSETTPPTARP